MKNIASLIQSKKKYMIILAILIVFIIGLFLLLQKPNAGKLYTVKQENLINTILVNGTYTTASQTEVASPARGVITELYVGNNDEVKKGDPLFHIESTATVDEQKAAYANYEAALSSLQAAQNTRQSLDAVMWTKQQAVLDAQNNVNYKNDKKDISNPSKEKDYTELEKSSIDSALTRAQKDFAAAEQAYKTADITVVAAQTQVGKTQLAYAETQSTTVTAPAAGTVVNLQKKVGDQVLAQAQNPSQPNQAGIVIPPVLVISDFSNPVLTASINEVNIPRIKTGQKAEIAFDALPDETFKGTVENIDTVGTKTQGTITYNAEIISSGLTPDVKPNMTASITIETGRKENVLTVPNTALTERDGKVFVQKAGDKSGTLTEITIGLRGLTKSEVVKGLSVGDRLLLQE